MVSDYIWPTILIIFFYLYLRYINDILLIILRIKKCNGKKAKQVEEFFLENTTREVTFYESPLFDFGFGIHLVSSNKVNLVVSKNELSKLSSEDITELIKNIFILYNRRKIQFNILSKIWSFVFVVPYAVILMPSLLVPYRLLIIEKFFALPIFSLSQVVGNYLGKNKFQDNDLSFRRNTMVSKIDEYQLGPHLLFHLNSSFYKVLREENLEN